MTIRYVRDGLRIVRVELAADLTTLHQRAAAAEAVARDYKERVADLKRNLLGDHHRRVGLLRNAASPNDPPAPAVAPSAVLRARKRAGVSQRDLAAGLKISRSSVAEAERGVRAPLPVLARWAALVLAAASEEVSA